MGRHMQSFEPAGSERSPRKALLWVWHAARRWAPAAGSARRAASPPRRARGPSGAPQRARVARRRLRPARPLARRGCPPGHERAGSEAKAGQRKGKRGSGEGKEAAREERRRQTHLELLEAVEVLAEVGEVDLAQRVHVRLPDLQRCLVVRHGEEEGEM
jgi:hypothetical protein